MNDNTYIIDTTLEEVEDSDNLACIDCLMEGNNGENVAYDVHIVDSDGHHGHRGVCAEHAESVEQ